MKHFAHVLKETIYSPLLGFVTDTARDYDTTIEEVDFFIQKKFTTMCHLKKYDSDIDIAKKAIEKCNYWLSSFPRQEITPKTLFRNSRPFLFFTAIKPRENK